MKLVYTLLILLASVSFAEACNIPVFRYALERWRPDECEVIVFHQGGLTPQQEALLAASMPAVANSPQNVSMQGKQAQATGARVIRADVAQTDGPHQDLWLQLAGDSPKSLPYVVVRAKIGTGRTVNAWHGPLDSVRDWDVFKSPARTEMARRLLSGHSVVWLVITSNDEDRNAQVRKMLGERLEALSDKIQLPDGIGLPGSELYSEIPLLVKVQHAGGSAGRSRRKVFDRFVFQFSPQLAQRGRAPGGSRFRQGEGFGSDSSRRAQRTVARGLGRFPEWRLFVSGQGTESRI